ncbi:MAG: DctP family TRAP transporter solute-binding subunit [Bacteroidetes bacterium]|nr:DctP family TRAP transporter solute-binding subunit [Bacteroidota bacterium]
MKRWMVYILGCWALLAIAGCGKAESGRVIQLGHGLDVEHSVHKGMEYMAEYVDSVSEGQLQIEIFPNQQLGTERQCLELLQIGSLGMTKVSSAVLEGFTPEMKVLSLPYIFRDRGHAYRVQDSPLGEELLLASVPARLRGLAYFDAGQRSFYTKEKPVRQPEDLEGLKIRVQESATAMQLVSALGASPTPISWGELYTALQQGVVDGAENNPPSFYLSHHYEVCKYYILNEHTAVPDILLIGMPLWSRLSLQEQEWLQEAAAAATDYQRQLWQAAEAKALEAVQEAGVEIIRPDKAPFFEQTQHLLEQYQDEPAIYELIQRIKAVE